jgi:hypothetical protein
VLAGKFDVGVELVRLTPTGALDATFGQGGRVRVADGRLLAGSVELAPDGRIAATYGTYPEPRTQGYSTMALYDASGTKVAATASFAGAFTAFAFAGTGVIAGAAYGTLGYQGYQPAVVRVRPDGAFSKIIDVAHPPQSVGVDGEGRIVIALFADSDFNSAHTFVLRLLADGRPDPSFAFGGTASVPTGTQPRPRETTEAAGGSAAVDRSNRIVVAGAPPRRLLPDGRPDPSFDAGSLAMASTVVYGFDARGGVLLGNEDRSLLVRLDETGAWDRSFGRCGAT